MYVIVYLVVPIICDWRPLLPFLRRPATLLRIDTAICRVGDRHSENTQLFLYCSGSERSVKCFRPALKMEASQEQRGVVRFWWLRVLRGAIKSKPPGMLSDGIHLLHDNARPPYCQSGEI